MPPENFSKNNCAQATCLQSSDDSGIFSHFAGLPLPPMSVLEDVFNFESQGNRNLKFQKLNLDSNLETFGPTQNLSHGLLQEHQSGAHSNFRESKEGRAKCFTCDLCDATFTTSYSKKRHHNVVHEKIRNFKCDKCNLFFANRTDQLQHDSAVHEKLKPHKCNHCDAFFSSTGLKNRHMRTHQALEPYSCTHCNASFNRWDSLKKHISEVHEGSRPFTCKVCFSSFKQKGHLKRHLERVHQT